MSNESQVPDNKNAPWEQSDNWQVFRNTLRLFLPIFALSVVMLVVILWINENVEMRETKDKNRITVETLAENVDSDILGVSSDLVFLANQRYTVEVWGKDGLPNTDILADVKTEYLGIAKSRGSYDQVRLLDANGIEIVRVNFNEGAPAIVPEAELQNKRDRYYFSDTFELTQGEIFVSPLDLNIENITIEQPLKPMIRFGMPVFDQSGTKRGIVVLNYFGTKLLDHFAHQNVSLAGASQLMLLNADGYWLKGPNPNDEWGFMFSDRQDRTFANAYPEAWETINSNDFSQFITDQGMFTSETVYPLLTGQKSSTGASEAAAPSQAQLEADEYYWKIVSFAPSDVLYANRNNRRINAALLVTVFSVLFWLGARRVAKENILRQLAEDALQEKEKYFHLFENTLMGAGIATPEGKVLAINKAMSDIIGSSLGETTEIDLKDVYVNPDDRKKFVERMQHEGIVENFEFQLRKKTGEIRWALLSSRLITYNGNPAFLTTVLDITTRVRAEEHIRLQALALEAAANAIMITDADWVIQWVNPAFSTLTGYSLNEIVGKTPSILNSGETDARIYKELDETISSGKTWQGELINKRKDGSHYVEESTIAPLVSADGHVTNFIAIKQDITERVHAKEAIQHYVMRLDALHQIDQAIIGSFDLRVILHILLEKVLIHLKVDAAAILQKRENSLTLEFLNGKGFYTAPHPHINIQLGKGKIGKAIQSRSRLFISDLTRSDADTASVFPELQFERFVSFYEIPLIVKGLLVGALQVFQRTPFELDDEWVDHLQMFADQAAIAIDNITLFDDLQRTNTKLVQAYDATIEGWARALELRDMETEGHSRRVVETTMALAQMLEIHGEKLIHVRRGALLHDIGKMGVPDYILQKPGALTNDEWDIMQQHPVYAYEWLKAIEYLSPALDIPYCHHEKWDGTGYPRGLKGELIPLAARIFAMADVWDALLSDRPYRKGWPKEKVLSYIQEQSGKQFDPKIVETFMRYTKNVSTK